MAEWKSINGRKPLNSWLYDERDATLIDKIKDYDGDRSALVVKALEAYFEIPAEQRRDSVERLIEEIAALRSAINGLPSRIVNQVTTSLAGLVIRNRGNDNPGELDTQPVITNEELERRRENRRQNLW